MILDFNSNSIKTRIETRKKTTRKYGFQKILTAIPLKQGLKPIWMMISFCKYIKF